MKQKKFYAVKNGRTKGVFENWTDCEKSVKGFSGAIYKSFFDEKSANEFIKSKKIKKAKKVDTKPLKKSVEKKNKWTKKDFAEYHNESKGLSDYSCSKNGVVKNRFAKT